MRIQKEILLNVIRLTEEWRSRSIGTASHTGRIALKSFLSGLSHQELIELMALMGVGRGDPGSDNFQTLVDNIHLNADRIVAYLLEKPNLAEDLRRGTAKLGFGIVDE